MFIVQISEKANDKKTAERALIKKETKLKRML